MSNMASVAASGSATAVQRLSIEPMAHKALQVQSH